MMGSTTLPFFIFGGTWLEMTAEFLPRIHSRGNTVIGNDVWIGRKAVVMAGVTISDGAIIGLERWSSRISPRTRRSEEIRPGLEEAVLGRGHRPRAPVAWWNWPVDVITEHVRTIWTDTPVELEQAAKDVGLLG